MFTLSRSRFMVRRSFIGRSPRSQSPRTTNFNNLNHHLRPLNQFSRLCNNFVASFEEIKSIKDQKDTLLIDVREPSELQETGVIPTSINIPLGEVESVLKDLSPEVFQNRFCRPKPKPSTAIIFSCRMGRRSAEAKDIANKLGFKNVKNYEGGWVEWTERNKIS